MILQRKNFNVPAQFSFQPFAAKWSFVNAEVLEWTAESQLMALGSLLADEPEKNWLRVRIEVPDANKDESGLSTPHMLHGIRNCRSYTVRMDRASIPPDVLQEHENSHNAPDVSGRSFDALICQKPEFREGSWALKPGEATKNAWAMLHDFLNLQTESESGSDWRMRDFLNKWGIWQPARGYSEDWESRPLRILAPSASTQEQEIDRPDFLLVMPHLLREQQERYRSAIHEGNARSWLRTHRLTLETAEEFPFHRVRANYCSHALETTITINHLSNIKTGICEWCHKVFEKDKNYKMSYCDRPCANAASVARFREKQRKAKAKCGGKRNAKG